MYNNFSIFAQNALFEWDANSGNSVVYTDDEYGVIYSDIRESGILPGKSVSPTLVNTALRIDSFINKMFADVCEQILLWQGFSENEVTTLFNMLYTNYEEICNTMLNGNSRPGILSFLEQLNQICDDNNYTTDSDNTKLIGNCQVAQYYDEYSYNNGIHNSVLNVMRNAKQLTDGIQLGGVIAYNVKNYEMSGGIADDMVALENKISALEA